MYSYIHRKLDILRTVEDRIIGKRQRSKVDQIPSFSCIHLVFRGQDFVCWGRSALIESNIPGALFRAAERCKMHLSSGSPQTSWRSVFACIYIRVSCKQKLCLLVSRPILTTIHSACLGHQGCQTSKFH